MKKGYLLMVTIFATLFIGCTTQKKLSYFNEVDQNAADSLNQKKLFRHQTRISIGDRIGISVSAQDPKAVIVFNMPFVGYAAPNSEQLSSAPTLQSYTVDIDGNIDFPQFGKLKVVGMTKEELIAFLTNKISFHVKNPIVNVQFFNLTVTVLGEVKKPGRYQFVNERTTILDALGLAGDITLYGKKQNVLIAREQNGKIEFQRINLNTPDVFTSPYYYVRQNDVILVEPNNVRTISAQNLPLVISSLSTLGSIITVIYSISQANKK